MVIKEGEIIFESAERLFVSQEFCDVWDYFSNIHASEIRKRKCISTFDVWLTVHRSSM